MALGWDNMAINWEGWLSLQFPYDPKLPIATGVPVADQATCEIYRPYLKQLYKKGFRHVRTAIHDTQQFRGGIADLRCDLLKSEGFSVHYGSTFNRFVHGNVLSPRYHKTIFEPLVLERFPLAIASGCVDVWSLGNEHEEGIYLQPVAFIERDASNIATVTFNDDHYYKVGDTVGIAGAVETDFNSLLPWSLQQPGKGSEILSVPTSKTFTYFSEGAAGSATGTLTARMTIETYIRLLKETAVLLRAIAVAAGQPNIKFIYSATENPIAVWQAVGITPGVDFDYFGMNGYGFRADLLPDFEIRQASNYAAFGANYWLTEWNLAQPYSWQSTYAPNIKMTEKYTEERINVLRTLGVSRAYYFKADGEPRAGGFGGGWMLYNYINNTPRNAYYAIVKERRTHLLRGITVPGSLQDISFPIVTMRKPRAQVNRGKCINFNTSTSKVAFTLPSSFAVSNLTRFSVIARVYTRSLGGGGQGMILDAIGPGPQEGFLNLRCNTLGTGEFRIECFRFPTNGACGSGPSTIVFNTWQTVVAIFDDTFPGQLYPRIYLDGFEKTTNKIDNSGIRGTTSEGVVATIGNNWNNSKAFDGLIDDVYIYNRVLNMEEICAFKNGGVPGQYLVGFNMDETSGDVIDSGPSQVNGTPSNVVQNVTSYISS